MDTPSFYNPHETQYLIDPDLESVVQMAMKLGVPLLGDGRTGNGQNPSGALCGRGYVES